MKCPICNEEFVPAVSHQIYCSEKCREWSKAHESREVRRARKRILPGFECRMCGKKVIPSDTSDRRTVFCSRECEKRWWRHPHDYGTGTGIKYIPKKYQNQ